MLGCPHRPAHDAGRRGISGALMLVPPETPRLRFRPYETGDEAALANVFADSESQRFYPEMAELIRVRSWIITNLASYAQHGLGLWALERRDTGAFLGDCGLSYQDVEGSPELEIGYHLVRAERGRGYATEAARACLDFGFERTSRARIGSIVHPANAASCTVAARVHDACREFVRRGTRLLFYSTERARWDARLAR
jgi:RimJ/RimL family protein N-acetyltransferase